jgi:hypothetical protein
MNDFRRISGINEFTIRVQTTQLVEIAAHDNYRRPSRFGEIGPDIARDSELC